MPILCGIGQIALAAGLVLAAGELSAQASPPAQVLSAPDTVRGALPAQAGGLAFIESRTFADSTLGTVYRYRGSREIRADVYIYPIPPEVRTASAEDVVRSEGAAFRAGLAHGPGQGWFDTYGIAYEGLSEVRAPHGVAPSYVAAIVFKQGDVVSTSFFAVYVLGRHCVKVRFTGPDDESMVEVAGKFVDDLAAQLDKGALESK